MLAVAGLIHSTWASLSASDMVHFLVCQISASGWQETSVSHHVDISVGQLAFFSESFDISHKRSHNYFKASHSDISRISNLVHSELYFIWEKTTQRNGYQEAKRTNILEGGYDRL